MKGENSEKKQSKRESIGGSHVDRSFIVRHDGMLR